MKRQNYPLSLQSPPLTLQAVLILEPKQGPQQVRAGAARPATASVRARAMEARGGAAAAGGAWSGSGSCSPRAQGRRMQEPRSSQSPGLSLPLFPLECGGGWSLAAAGGRAVCAGGVGVVSS